MKRARWPDEVVLRARERYSMGESLKGIARAITIEEGRELTVNVLQSWIYDRTSRRGVPRPERAVLHAKGAPPQWPRSVVDRAITLRKVARLGAHKISLVLLTEMDCPPTEQTIADWIHGRSRVET